MRLFFYPSGRVAWWKGRLLKRDRDRSRIHKEIRIKGAIEEREYEGLGKVVFFSKCKKGRLTFALIYRKEE